MTLRLIRIWGIRREDLKTHDFNDGGYVQEALFNVVQKNPDSLNKIFLRDMQAHQFAIGRMLIFAFLSEDIKPIYEKKPPQ